LSVSPILKRLGKREFGRKREKHAGAEVGRGKRERKRKREREKNENAKCFY